MMKGTFSFLSLALALFAVLANATDEQRDFYAEPGMNPFKTAGGQDVTENIDPFSGNVQLSYVDLSIPGNGGMDINVTRVYNLPQSTPSYNNPYGYGWTMHFGRITIPSGNISQLCFRDILTGDTRGNPSIEMPDGGRELLVKSSVLEPAFVYITKTNWKAECIDPQDHTKGIKATAPNGTVYYMVERVSLQGEDGSEGEPGPFVETWLTNKIEDVYGNTLDITYQQNSLGHSTNLIAEVSSPDGRLVTYTYKNSSGAIVTNGSPSARLSEITANGQTWEYHYDPVTNNPAWEWQGPSHYKLTQVIRPDGTSWGYEYGVPSSAPDYDRLTKVTYPFGGEVNYTYQKFKPYSPNANLEIIAIDTKTQSNPGQAVGAWVYEFFPGSVDLSTLGYSPCTGCAGIMVDSTKIITPLGVERLYHYGYWAMVGRTDALWSMGLKLKHDYISVDPDDQSEVLIRTIRNSWGSREISNEQYKNGVLTTLWDNKVYATTLLSEWTSVDGFSYRVDYVNHDAFGNPQLITEYSTRVGASDRITNAVYLNNTTDWFIGLPVSETVSQDGIDIGTINRTYNTLGKLESEDRFGVLTQYTYTANGDVNTVTDARAHITTYSNYFRGSPQQEEYPDGTQLLRAINPTGTVASETSGRGHTASFNYDGLNRLTGINYPIGADVSINWLVNSKTLTRGNYEEKVEWDGFGRDIKVTRKDTALGLTFVKDFQYDALGRKEFESDPNSANGITWEYDVLSRTTKVSNQDNTSKSITYEGSYREIHYDEKNNLTEYRYLVFGKPENKLLTEIFSAEDVGTIIGRDVYGNITSVFQGEPDPGTPGQYLGYTKAYGYNANFFLETLSSPADIGLTTYGRDAVGNMTSKQVGSSNTTIYNYDPMNRVETTDYVDDAIDVTYAYDDDGNVQSITNSYGSRTYGYDENGNLTQEDIVIGVNAYQVQYVPDSLDNVSQVVYPSGRSVSYAPDALGRPTQALPYLSNVAYYPDGSVQQMDYANGRSTSFTRTARKWIDTITVAGGTTLADLDYNYDDLGNIEDITDNLDGSKTRTMTYDNLSRLKTVTGIWGLANYDYDVYSNLTQKTDPARNNRNQGYQYNGLLLSQIDYSIFQSRFFVYDDYGNLTGGSDIYFDINGQPAGTGTERSFTFDDAGNMTYSNIDSQDASGNPLPLRSGSITSEYDGKNNRIRKINHSDSNKETEFLYSEAGLLLGEYDQSGSLYGQEHFYLGTQQVATVKKNAPPFVDAGADQQTYGGVSVNLSGIDSDVDGTVVSRQWTQVSGPAITINNATSQNTSFDAPGSSVIETVVLEYTVTDDKGGTATDQISISIDPNSPPVANAGPDQMVIGGQVVTLNGTLSSDLEGPITYSWSGSEPLDDNTSPTPSFLSDIRSSNYSRTFTLTVSDSAGVQDTDQVLISILSPSSDSDDDGLGNAWEVINFGDDNLYTGEDDPDGDGVTNLQEYLDDTDPNIAEPTTTVTKLTVLPGDAENTFVWEKVLNASQYKVFWSTDPNSDISSWNQLTTTKKFYDHQGIVNGTTYYYAVAAGNALGEGAVSAVVAGMPNGREWQLPIQLPDVSSTFDLNKTIVAANKFSDLVVMTEMFENNLYRLYAWQYSIFDGWGNAELVNEHSDSHTSFEVAIDSHQNILASWVEVGTTIDHLYSRYRLSSGVWLAEDQVENYSIQYQEDGDVTEVSYLGFLDNGEAFACWLQSRAHVFQTYYDPDGASALVKKFHPKRGWFDEHNLEVPNNTGDTTELRCDVSSSGDFVASWSRRDSFYPPGDSSYDVWVSAYSRQSGWQPSETVEFMERGIRERRGDDIESYFPRVTVSEIGKALVVWRDSSEVDIESLEFDFDSFNWLPQDTIESRNNQVSGSSLPNVASNNSGDYTVLWGDKFSYKLQGANKWERSESLPSSPSVYLGIDSIGQPISVGISGADILASRYIDGSWVTQTLNDSADTQTKTFKLAELDTADDLLVYWMSGSELYLSANIPPSPTPPGNQPPLSSAGNNQAVLEGSLVQLDGSASSDSDGVITDYLWQQLTGTPATLSSTTSALTSFTAPLVLADEQLTFELTITDDQGATDSDSVGITVQDSASNVVPTANAGLDQTVTEGDAVQLDGSASTDSDGSIVSYLWQQTAGTTVTLSDSNSATPSFTAPLVLADEQFTFQLTVTDDQGATDSDSITVTVQDMEGPDTTPPVTTFSTQRQMVQGKPRHTITLTVNEPATTYFRFNGQGTITGGGIDTTAWQTYTTDVVIQLDKKGSGDFEFYSEDTAGNVEATQLEVLQ